MQKICKSLVLLIVLLLCSCGLTDPSDKMPGSAEKNAAESSDATEYVDPAAPEDGGIDIEVHTAGVIMDYFAEVAFGSEFGNSPLQLCRWEREIVYTVTGSPAEADLELIATVAERLNTIEGFPGMRRTNDADDANFEIMFITRAEIIEQFKNADESCKGMSEFHWYTDSCEIFKARAAIDCEAVEERESTVCEEVLQALGLARDSFQHRDSVFYQGTCLYRRPSELDYTMVRLLYHPELSTGMSRYEALTAASALLKW